MLYVKELKKLQTNKLNATNTHHGINDFTNQAEQTKNYTIKVEHK